jgi:hypothetical protein
LPLIKFVATSVNVILMKKKILSLKPWVEGSNFSVYDVSVSERRFWIRLRTSEGTDFKLSSRTET